MASSNFEQVLAQVHRQYQRHCRDSDAPEKQTESELLQPGDKTGPDEIPTTAMNMFSPTEFMNQTVGDGIRPKVDGRNAASQEKACNQNAPEVESVSGTLPAL